MPGRKPIRLASWQWFHDELLRQLGQAAYDALFAELAARRKAEQVAKQKKVAAREIASYEAQRDQRVKDGKPTKRIEASLAHWRAIRDAPEGENH